MSRQCWIMLLRRASVIKTKAAQEPSTTLSCKIVWTETVAGARADHEAHGRRACAAGMGDWMYRACGSMFGRVWGRTKG